MVVTPLDFLAAVALIALGSGLGSVTYRAADLLARLVPPRRGWIQRGVLLVLLAGAYLGLMAADVPGVLAALSDPDEQASLASVTRTSVLAAWLWTLTTILLMLARGRLGEKPIWRGK